MLEQRIQELTAAVTVASDLFQGFPAPANEAAPVACLSEVALRNYTDEELIRTLQFSDNPEVAELIRRFEANADEHETALADEKENLVDWAVDCFSEHAGEDHHVEVSDILLEALKLNKPEMKQAIEQVIEKLEEMDTAAGRMIEAMQSGDAF